jgi:ferric iron reductase protein FhuF
VAESLSRLDAGVSWAEVRAAPDSRPGWVRCSDLLADPDRLRDWQRATASAYGGGDDDGALTGQGLVLDWYLAAITLPAAGVFHLDRRVLDLAPERMLIRVGRPGAPVAATAVESPRYTCLPGDEDADLDATVVDGIDALAGRLRTGVVGHAGRLLAVYDATTRIGSHALWGAVTDALDVAFMIGGWVSGAMARAAADARLVLGDGTEPLVGGSTLHEIDDARGRRHWTRRRWSCCYLYRAPGVGECVTCPRVSEAERRRQAASW